MAFPGQTSVVFGGLVYLEPTNEEPQFSFRLICNQETDPTGDWDELMAMEAKPEPYKLDAHPILGKRMKYTSVQK